MKVFYYLFTSMLLIFAVSCSSNKDNDEDQTLPPPEILKSNYELADLVFTTTTVRIIAEDTLWTDEGKPGYVKYLFKTKVISKIKGETSITSDLDFRVIAEYSEDFIAYWQNQKKLLVFLKNDSTSKSLFAIESGIFPLSDKLQQHIREIF